MRNAWLCLAACAALALAPEPAGADATPRVLRVRALPAVPPTNLRMRPAPVAGAARAALAQGTDAAAAPGTDGAAPGAPAAAPQAGGTAASMPGPRRNRDSEQSDRPSLAERTMFHFNIGFGLDGGQASNRSRWWNDTACGQDSGCLAEYTRNRIYGFGDVVLGSRGVLASSLNTYFAAQFRMEQDLRGFSAVPSAYDGEGVDNMQLRSAYGELVGLFESRWLKPLYVRAGRQYRYGTAVTHFDGVNLSYDTRVVSLGLFSGNGVSLYNLTGGLQTGSFDPINGMNARLNLAALGYGPIVLTGNTLYYQGINHADLAVAVRWRRNLDTHLRLRSLEGDLAQADMQVRTRLSAVTVAMLDLEHSTQHDWRYDAILAGTQPDPTDVRRYLGLEPPGPRTYLSLRAGTVLLDNVDLLVRGTGVIEHDDPDDDDPDAKDASLASSYFELGVALELRLQRTLSVGLSTVAREYQKQEPPDLAQNPLGLLGPQELGENYGYAHTRSFVEGGTVVRYTQGARLFSADAEVYLRVYERQMLYEIREELNLEAPTEDERVGGRISVESWAGERLRLRLEYDVTTELAVISELRGLKSLRVLMEGRF